MSGVQQSRSTPQHARARPAHLRSEARSATARLGWVLFVGIVLLAAGLIGAVQGLVALFDDEFYLALPSDLMIDVNYAVWGWALLIMGAALVAAGCAVVLGYAWGRGVGVVVAAVNALVNLGFVTEYPIWSMFAVSFDILAIYALVIHGSAAMTIRTAQR